MAHYVTVKKFTNRYSMDNHKESHQNVGGGGGGICRNSQLSIWYVLQWHLAVQYIACALTTPGCRLWQEWNIVPRCVKGSAEFMGIAGIRDTLPYLTIQNIPNVLYGRLVWRIGRPREDWDVFSFQKRCAYSGNLRPVGLS